MTLSLRILAYLLVFRLLVLDLTRADDSWGWLLVVFDLVLAYTIYLDRAPDRAPATKDNTSDRH
ncbi:hypothetical protein [Amycolatopsis sp. lyj-84]|uniref:hypothetical protein n=1 Tax=Amycolatopsis sp. lyj-84 TaxID=2789284 RepID=UPI00397C78E5